MSSTYDFEEVGESNFEFITDFDLKYRATFSDASGYFPKNPEMAGIFKGFSFQIVSTQPRQIPLDPRIGDTIAAIILRFLDQNPNAALFFIHDAADGRARGRKRTFDSWLKRLRLHEFLKKDDEIIVGRFTVLVSIVLRKNHPHSLQITEAFDQLIVDASEKPED